MAYCNTWLLLLGVGLYVLAGNAMPLPVLLSSVLGLLLAAFSFPRLPTFDFLAAAASAHGDGGRALHFVNKCKEEVWVAVAGLSQPAGQWPFLRCPGGTASSGDAQAASLTAAGRASVKQATVAGWQNVAAWAGSRRQRWWSFH
ncbi:hypothetical protein L7F22_045859 [Adiantum nelumboides]|nr:hypothetical protein [Adiantum nelumboides]